MQNLKILNSKEIKNILKLLRDQFGFDEKPDYVFLINKKSRIYVINRGVSMVNLESLRIDALGMYFGTLTNDGLRLSIEGSQIIGRKAAKNILDISKDDMSKWLKGEDFDIDTALEGFVLVKHGNDFLGCGKVRNGVLMNYVSKARRLIVVNN